MDRSATPEYLRDFIQRYRLTRRGTLRLFGLGTGLLAACRSEGPAGPAAPPTSSPMTTAPTTPSPAVAVTPTISGQPVMGGTLVIGVDQEPPTMDPHASPSAITFYITASTGESLLYLDENRELRPWLAESWEVSEDAKSFTFVLRKDAKFQDDTPVNAEAVKWNFDRIVDPNFKAGGALAALTGYTGTDLVDEFTARVNFERPFVPFLTYAAGGTLALLSPTATPGQGDQVNQTPVMSGPYKIQEYVPKDHVTIVRWDGYNRRAPWADHDGPGYLDSVVWKFIPEAGTRVTTVESGETHMVTVIPAQDLPRFESSQDFKVEKRPWVGAPRIWLLNVSRPPTDELEVRQAINYAIDKDVIVNTVYAGIGTKAVAPMTKVMLDDPSLHEYYSYDPTKATQLLEEAGWVAGPNGTRQRDGQPLQLVLNAIDYGGGPEPLVQLIQGQLREVGIDVQIKAQARPPWYEDNYHCATNGPVMFLRSGDLDGLYALFHSSNVGGNFNWSCLKDPEIDRMLERGREERDPQRRRALYLDLEKKLLDMAVTVPLVDELSVWVMRANANGLKFNGFTYPVVADVWIGE